MDCKCLPRKIRTTEKENPMKYKCTFADGATMEIDAVSMRRDGSGLYLFDAEGNQVAAWADGDQMPRSCVPAAAKRVEPAREK